MGEYGDTISQKKNRQISYTDPLTSTGLILYRFDYIKR